VNLLPNRPFHRMWKCHVIWLPFSSSSSLTHIWNHYFSLRLNSYYNNKYDWMFDFQGISFMLEFDTSRPGITLTQQIMSRTCWFQILNLRYLPQFHCHFSIIVCAVAIKLNDILKFWIWAQSWLKSLCESQARIDIWLELFLQKAPIIDCLDSGLQDGDKLSDLAICLITNFFFCIW